MWEILTAPGQLILTTVIAAAATWYAKGLFDDVALKHRRKVTARAISNEMKSISSHYSKSVEVLQGYLDGKSEIDIINIKKTRYYNSDFYVTSVPDVVLINESIALDLLRFRLMLRNNGLTSEHLETKFGAASPVEKRALVTDEVGRLLATVDFAGQLADALDAYQRDPKNENEMPVRWPDREQIEAVKEWAKRRKKLS